MKKIILFALTFFIILCVHAQTSVNLNYSTKKIAANTFELHITAVISDGWHLYSQDSDSKGGIPATISFIKNPLIITEGRVKEVGVLKSNFEELFGVTVKYYENKVDFIQVVKTKGNIKTNIAGSFTYMVCNDRECMPPTTKKFSVTL